MTPNSNARLQGHCNLELNDYFRFMQMFDVDVCIFGHLRREFIDAKGGSNERIFEI